MQTAGFKYSCKKELELNVVVPVGVCFTGSRRSVNISVNGLSQKQPQTEEEELISLHNSRQ